MVGEQEGGRERFAFFSSSGRRAREAGAAMGRGGLKGEVGGVCEGRKQAREEKGRH